MTIEDARYSINAGVYNGGIVCAENNGTITNCHSKNCLVVFNSCNHFGGIVGDNKGTIENCTSENAFTLDSKAGKIGGIASNNSGNIINCTNRTVIMSAGSDYSTTGGIVATNSGKIILCCNLASISTTSTYQNRSAYTGGIVGSMSAGEVSKCYNAAPISSVTEKYSSNAYSGGLVAYLSGGTISNSYNVGNVFAINNAYSGKAYVGGLMGYNKSINDSNNCYVISSVYASSHEETYSGIICGYSSVATIINCYFVGVQSSAVGYGDASSVYAVTREDLKLASTLPEFDFSNTWTLEGGAYLYPEIKDNLHVCLTHYEEVIPELKATCTADGHTSGIKCYLCGTIIEEPSLVEKLGHVFLNEWFWQSDENYHWNICNREGCYDICDKIAHVFDHDCDEQCNDCGYRRTITHTYNGDWISNDFCHWKKCDTVGCNSIGPQTTHYYSDNNCESICVCGYVNPVKHDFASSWKYDSTGHWHNCKNFACTAIAEKQEHSYSNSCDITCDCGYVRSVTHDFSEAWEHDASGHWHICLTAECNVIDAKQSHQYSNSCDTSCDCGYTRTVTHDFTGVWQKDDASHWHICKTNGCNITDTKVAHSYDNACDTTCECGYTRVIVHDFNGAWQKDEDGHWHVCENGCGTTETKNNHISNGTATETAPEVCTICGWIITPALGHTTHTPGIDWESDETDHWHGCIGCDEQSFDKAHHTDCDNNGTCDTCSYSMPIKPPTHIHTYGIMWEINAVEHWKECECGEKIDKGMHKNLNNDEKCDECDYILISYLQEFIEAVSNLSKDSLLEIEYTEMYNALQLYNKLTAEEKVVANDSFLVLQNKIAEYNEKADLANNELKKSTEIAFLPISLNFTFLAALLFLLKKKIWIN